MSSPSSWELCSTELWRSYTQGEWFIQDRKMARLANVELNTIHTREQVSKAVINTAKSKFGESQWQIHDRILVIPCVMLSKTLFSLPKLFYSTPGVIYPLCKMKKLGPNINSCCSLHGEYRMELELLKCLSLNGKDKQNQKEEKRIWVGLNKNLMQG